MIQKSFVMMKPDAVQRRLMGKILSRFEEKGLQIVAVKLMQIDEELAKTHYGEHAEKPFFPSLVEYITSSPALAMVIEGEEAITTIRKLVGATNPLEADLGTIRGDFGMNTGRNIIHASDAPESAEREIALFFNEDEIILTAPTASIEFLGWYLDHDATSNQVIKIEKGTTGDLILYAKWEEVVVPDVYSKINYVLDGGTNDENNPQEYLEGVSTKLYPAEKPGYVFVGWSKDKGNQGCLQQEQQLHLGTCCRG